MGGPTRAIAAPDWRQDAEGIPPMRVFTARDTGITTMAWSAAQDPNGTLYFGCDTVVSFDGDRWHAENMAPTYLVRGLDVGPNGRIWTAGVNEIGWFDQAAQGQPVYHSLMDRLPKGAADLGDVWRVYALGNDQAVFVARERVLRWDGHGFTIWDYPGKHLVWSTRTGKGIYVHYPPVGLLRLDADGPVVAAPSSVVGPEDIRWLDDSGDDWLLLTAGGFKRLHAGTCTPLDTEASEFARANTPTSVVRLRKGVLAVGSLQGGLALVDNSGSILRIFNVRSGLPANQVYSLFVDRAGALWEMGPANIVRLAIGSDSAVYGPRCGYPPGGCSSLARSGQSLFAVSHSDVLRLSPDPESGGAGRFAALGVKKSRFYSLLSAPSGLVVGHFRGLGLITADAMKPVTSLEEAVFRLSPSAARPSAVLASLYDRVLSIDPESGASRVVADSLPDYGDTVVDEPSGRVWIGTPSRGLFVAGVPTVGAEPAGPRFGPLPSSGPALVARAGSTIVVLANGSAFVLGMNDDRFRQVTGLPAGSPIAISNADGQGAVWAAFVPGAGGRTPLLGKITPSKTGAMWMPQSFEGISSIGSLVALQVFHSAGRDELWILGTESLLRSGPGALAALPPPRKPAIRAWLRSGERLGEGAIGDALPYSTPGIHVECSSLDYGMRESERFQMMLDGADSQWPPPTESSEREISGLREGRYAFKARLVTDSGVAGDAAELHFEISPPWWRTALARVALAAAAIIAILGLLRFRTGALKRRAEILEWMVRQRTEDLEKANAAKTEFVANMSHEIRNPMGGILASALELSRAPLDPEHQRAVTTLRSCATFLASLVEDVLDFAAIEAGAYKVARSPYSPSEVLGNVVKMLQPRAPGARIDMEDDPALPGILLGDSARIQQVLVNFTANALKFGGKAVRLSARAEGSDVVFAVADDGEGIPPDEQKNLFVRFSRLKSARNSAVPGTGLGLAVCRALAERMGGSVGYSTALGHGSTFFMRLPLVANIGNTPGAPGLDAHGARALVVEDIKYNARALGSMLGDLGFEVEFALDGNEALARLSSSVYRVVFLDCDIPYVNGIEVARRFRTSEPDGAHTFILATTAYSAAEIRERCIGAGMDAFITKPITPEKLREALASLVGAASPKGPVPGGPGPDGLDLRLVLRLADGSAGSKDRELAAFVAALDEAMRLVHGAHQSHSRPSVSSAAHRVLSLASMVGATALAASAADVQEYAGAYTDAELTEEIGRLGGQALALSRALAPAAKRDPLNPASAS